MSGPPPRVALDVQATQSRHHAERGIARYVSEHAAAVERMAPGRVDAYLLNRRFTVPPGVERLLPTGRLRWSDAPDAGLAEGPLVFHALSPFELALPLGELWPLAVRRPGVRLVVTLYDLIPLVFPEVYLADPITRARYRSRLELVRAADRVLAISAHTGHDATRLAGVDPARVRVIGTGVSEGFRPATRPHAELAAELAERVPGLRPGHLLCTGGIDFRKNLDHLIASYADLPAATRRAHQLVITCSALPHQVAALQRTAATRGAEEDLLVTGYVPDDVLRGLYQAAHAFVFPSLYEGFGLPVAEALRCGAPVIAAEGSSLTELIADPEARFDPRDRAALTALLARVCGDPAFRARLTDPTGAADRFTWDAVGAATAEVYEEAWGAARARGRAARQPRIALVTPFPPQLSGIARYSAQLATELARDAAVDVFVDGDPAGYDRDAAPGCRLHSAEALARRHELVRYDAVLHCMGNSSFHDFVLAAMRAVPGAVLAHDVRLARFYEWRAWRDGGWLAEALTERYGDRVAPAALEAVPLMPADADRYGIWLTGELSALATRVLVHSRLAREVVRLEGAEGAAPQVEVLPFAFPAPVVAPTERAATPAAAPRIVSFGVVDGAKRVGALVAALPAILARHPGARLALVGPVRPWEARRLAGIARELGVTGALTLTGAVEDAAYRAWLARADVAIQLREVPHGEASATVTETLANGVPTIVSDLGWMGDLPDATVRKLAAASGPGEIADAVLALLGDPQEWRRLGRAGAAHAAGHDFATTAAVLRDALLRPGPAVAAPAPAYALAGARA